MIKRKFFLGFLLWFLFLFVGIFTQSHYGINWDEPTHFMRGQAYFHYFITGKKDYSDLPKLEKYYQKENTIFFDPVGENRSKIVRRSIYQNDNYPASVWLSGADDYAHPPLSGILAAASNYIFFQKLGIINDVDSLNLYMVFASSLLVFCVYFWVSKRYGIFAGVFSAISLSIYPLFLAESHYNIKDPPEAVFYSLTLLSFYNAVTKKSNKWMLISSVLFGIAWASKFNIVFAPFVMLIWLCFYIFPQIKRIKDFLKLIPSIIYYPIISFSILVLSWPILWSSPFQNFMKVADFYRGMGVGGGGDVRYLSIFGINTYPAQWILFTTPIIILFFFIFGLLYIFKQGMKEKNKTAIFILVWFLIPILRVTAPGASIYGGSRQFMEYIPAMAILAGIGALWLRTVISSFIIKSINKKILKKKILLIISFLLVFSFLPAVLKLISIHPNEGVYFNPLIGGLKGAKEMDMPYWGESLGNPNRQGLSWINENAEKNAKIAINYGLGTNLPSVLIRSDINFSNSNKKQIPENGEYIIGLTNKNMFEDTYLLKYLDRFLTPVREVSVDGVPILKVWKNDIFHTKKEFVKDKLYIGNLETSIRGNVIYISLEREVVLRKITLSLKGDECKKNEDDIDVEISSDNKSWMKADNGLGRYILIPGIFEDPNLYIYYFAAERGRYIRFSFISSASCLKNTIRSAVFVL
ncbi:MAG: glycosyltransferase family 39 protein [Candidatus Levybacteria bacterium]|nr:glycosyltransferase family 39 protein [Candidatus Levybacteria bacterium]